MSDRLLPHDAALQRLKALHPREIDLTLDRLVRLLDALGRPQDRLGRVVHVAGTNAKGSTIAFLRAMAEAAGLGVNVYATPHLVRFAERIRLSGRLIGDEALADLLARVETANAGAPITFFEITTAAAFLAFAEAPADLTIVEVGMGGRTDATNVVGATALSVIAPIDLDHLEFLGPSIEDVAAHKAGILKRGVPGVIARQPEAVMAVIEAEADRIGAPLTEMGRDCDAYLERGRLVFQDEAGLLDLPAPALFGEHQADNAGLAVAAARALGLGDAAIARGVETAAWPARFQRLTAGPFGEAARARGADLWLDGGHNPHAAKALARALGRLAGDGRPVVLVVGMLANKDADGFFAAFRELAPRVFACGFEGGAAAGDLAAEARRAGLVATPCGDVREAVDAALAGDGPAPHVLICGSLYLAGEVLAAARETWPE